MIWYDMICSVTYDVTCTSQATSVSCANEEQNFKFIFTA